MATSVQTKQRELDRIAAEIASCRICQQDSIGLPVPGEGNPNARIVFIGEAPGKTEARTGRPFVGRSGKLLRQLIGEAGLREEDVFITSPVKYLPARGTPNGAQIRHAKVHFDKQMAVIAPDIIVLLGSVACMAVLGQRIPVYREHGTVKTDGGRTYFITVHPAAALRFRKMKEVLLSDFRQLPGIITHRQS